MNADQESARDFCGLLSFLHKSHADWSSQITKREKEHRINAEVIERVQVISLQKLRSISEDAIKGKQPLELGVNGKDFLFLRPPPTGHVLPVLTLRSAQDWSSLEVQTGLFTFDRSEGKRKLAAIGFRFETPEEKGRKNCYYHSQMIQTFERGLSTFPGVPRWLPDTIPALPISATTPFSLFLGVLISLYGVDYLEKDWKGQRFLGSLREDMACIMRSCGHL